MTESRQQNPKATFRKIEVEVDKQLSGLLARRLVGHTKILARYARAAKLPDDVPVHAHMLRHTFAYLFLKKYPGDIRTLADLLGHNDLKTTMRYTASTETDKAVKMAGMD
jgi:integrase